MLILIKTKLMIYIMNLIFNSIYLNKISLKARILCIFTDTSKILGFKLIFI